MMPLRKLIQFVAALVLGLVLTLSSYPAQSQELPSFDTCFQEVNSYPKNQDLNRYSTYPQSGHFVNIFVGAGLWR